MVVIRGGRDGARGAVGTVTSSWSTDLLADTAASEDHARNGTGWVRTRDTRGAVLTGGAGVTLITTRSDTEAGREVAGTGGTVVVAITTRRCRRAGIGGADVGCAGVDGGVGAFLGQGLESATGEDGGEEDEGGNEDARHGELRERVEETGERGRGGLHENSWAGMAFGWEICTNLCKR
jgi:hypothetical protein